MVEHTRRVLFHLPNLNVLVPEPDYLLAMKALAARTDTEDESDVVTLIDFLGLEKPEDVFEIIEKYYPKGHIPPKTQYFIGGLFEK